MDSSYFIQDDSFCKTEPAFMEKVRPLTALSRNGEFHFQMGRNTLSNFYHNVLPQLQEVADITEENPENSDSTSRLKHTSYFIWTWKTITLSAR